MRTRKGVRRKRRTTTTEEARRWDEEPSGQVKGDSDPYYRSICQSQAYRPLNVSVYVYTATQVPIVNQVKNLNHLFLYLLVADSEA